MPTAISQLPEIADADFSSDDCFVVVDTDDISSAPTGTTKKITKLAAFTNVVITTALKFADAVGKIIPGATSLSIRNHTDTEDNLLIADNGDVTVRGKFNLATAISKLIPGATSFSLRNHADSADNLIVSDAGVATSRAGVTMASSSAPLTCAKFLPVSAAWVVRDSGDANDNFRVYDSTGAIEARGAITGPRATLNGDTSFGHILMTAMASAPTNPSDGILYWDGSDLYIYDGTTRYKFSKTLAP